MDELLFYRIKLSSFKSLILKVAKERIRSISKSDVETKSLKDIKETLLNLTIVKPVFFTDEFDLEYREEKGRKHVTRYRMFTGDERLFDVEPSSSTFNPPRGEITTYEGRRVLAFSGDFDLSTTLTDAVQGLERRMPDIQTFISKVNLDLTELNRSVSELVDSDLPIRYTQIKKDIDDYNFLKSKK